MPLVCKPSSNPDHTVQMDDGSCAKQFEFGCGHVSLQELNPGWKWSTHAKAQAGTDCCDKEHLGYVVSGKVAVKMNDGEEKTFGPGDCFHVTPGHDGWVVGDEKVKMVEFIHKEHSIPKD